MIQRIVDEISREYFVEEAAAFVEDEENVGKTLSSIADRVVRVYVDDLDNVFLASLLAYMKAAEEADKPDVVELLGVIYDQILLVLREKLPPAAQVTEILTQIPSQQDRRAVLAKACKGGSDDGDAASPFVRVPPCQPGEVLAAAHDMVSSMEGAAAMDEGSTDRLLLYRLCCVREEARDYANAVGNHAGDAFPPSLPQAELALLKELLQVPAEARMRSLLLKAFGDDWAGTLGNDAERAVQTLKAPPGVRSGRRGKGMRAERGRAGAADAIVSPGRFLECASALKFECDIEDNVRITGAGTARMPPPEVKRRIALIRTNAMQVLRELAEMDDDDTAKGKARRK